MRQQSCFKKWLELKGLESLHDFLSCNIWFSKDKKNSWLGQPFLIESPESLW